MKHIATLLFAILFLAACTENNTVTEIGTKADTTVIWLDSLEKIDQDLLADETMNVDKGWKAFQAFRKFARENPNHPLAPTYHMKAASIARNIRGKSLMAIEEYMTVYKMYPQDTLAPQALFLVGFTFDQNLNDAERAAKSYNLFIDRFPEHELANQARNLVAMLNADETDLEQIKNWEKNPKNKEEQN